MKFVDEAGGGIGEINVAQRIDREGNRGVKLPGAFAFVAPSALEFKWRRRRLLGFRRGIGAVSASNEK